MSAKEAKKNPSTFLQHAELRNYKSIKELQVDFNPGLNIVIGDNGSGKTNFLNCLYNILTLNYKNQPDTDSKIQLITSDIEFELTASVNTDTTSFNPRLSKSHNYKLLINNKAYKKEPDIEDINAALMAEAYYSNGVIIRHLNPYNNSAFIANPHSFSLLNNGKMSREIYNDFGTTYFTSLYLLFLTGHVESIIEHNSNVSLDYIKDNITGYSSMILSELNDELRTYTPINAIRLNPDFKLIATDGNQTLSVVNFYMEFNVNDQWLPYNFLSDGTKRLFYIICECSDHLSKRMNGVGGLDIILVEEPELGIHPHQLHQLMQFVKQKSRWVQVVITTHAPQVLDFLDADELDKIIICTYDSNRGTQLHHLTEKQIKKAQKYMSDDGFLSEYWRFSDLEPHS